MSYLRIILCLLQYLVYLVQCPRYINKLINMAANFAPGIPNITVVIIEVAFCALLAPSGPITPLIFPLPNFSFGLAATADHKPTSLPSVHLVLVISPINAPMNPPRSASQRFSQTGFHTCH